MITFLHTVLTCELVELKTALVLCPLNTVLNWRAEFDKWQCRITKSKVEVGVCFQNLIQTQLLACVCKSASLWHSGDGVGDGEVGVFPCERSDQLAQERWCDDHEL